MSASAMTIMTFFISVMSAMSAAQMHSYCKQTHKSYCSRKDICELPGLEFMRMRVRTMIYTRLVQKATMEKKNGN